MFLETIRFDFIRSLESHWQTIRQELEALRQDHFIPWPEKFLYQQGWNVFGLYAFGKKLEKNCQLCPETTQMVEAISGMTTAGFSSLAPNTHILPHTGYSKAVLRCHLGLIVPEGCCLRVGNEQREWQEGQCLVFDDTVNHEAWNPTEQTRVLLLIDFQKSSNLASQKINLYPA